FALVLFYVTYPHEISTLSLHDALPISVGKIVARHGRNDRVLELHSAHGFRDALWFVRLQRQRPRGAHGAEAARARATVAGDHERDRKSTRLNSSHVSISYAVFCLKKKK